MANEIKVGDCFRDVEEYFRVLEQNKKDGMCKVAAVVSRRIQLHWLFESRIKSFCTRIPFAEYKQAVDRVVEQALEVK